jgi:hypothetical protein
VITDFIEVCVVCKNLFVFWNASRYLIETICGDNQFHWGLCCLQNLVWNAIRFWIKTPTCDICFLAHLIWKLTRAFLIAIVLHLSICLSVNCKHFKISTSSPEALGEFQPSLTQIIIYWRRIRFVDTRENTSKGRK